MGGEGEDEEFSSKDVVLSGWSAIKCGGRAVIVAVVASLRVRL